MDKKTRFKPASFLEVDDLYGGRKVVMVGADGITFWDALEVEVVTPIVIHPIFKPVEIGPLIEFARRNDLLEALRTLTQHVNSTQAERAQRDPLYVMRVLVAYSKGSCDGTAAAVASAISAANEEEARAIGAQAIYEKFADESAQDGRAH